jgi:hypothetical protein
MTMQTLLAVPAARTRPAVAARLSVFGLFCLLALALTAVCPIAPMDDFLNHLARMHLLFDERDGAPSPYYQSAWALYPNLAMDLTVPMLARWTGVERAAQIFLALSQILIVGGAAALELAVKRRFDYAGFVALLLLYSIPFAWGFANFQFGCGLALCGVAAWIALRETHPALRLAIHGAFVAALFVSHLVALGVYGFTLGVLELHRAAMRRSTARATASALALLAAPAVAAATVMVLSAGAVGHPGNDWDWPHKPVWPVAALNGYSLPLSAVGFGLLAWIVLRLRAQGALRLHPGGGALAGSFLLLYLATPQILRDTAFVDVRVAVAAFLILPALVSFEISDAVWRRRVPLALAALLLVNFAFTARLWLGYRRDYAQIVASFALLRPESKILVAASENGSPLDAPELAPMTHAPTLAAHYAKALVTTVMATPGKQPLIPRPGFERLNSQDSGPVFVDDLRRIAAGAPAPAYLRDWFGDYDYLYVVGAPRDNPLPGSLSEIERRERYALYRIVKPARE